MARYAGSVAGSAARGQAAARYWPAARVPAEVVVADSRLWAPPTAQPVKPPVAGTWRNFADTDQDDLAAFARIARRFGGLTAQAQQDGGEAIEVWQALIADLRPLAAAWDAVGQAADSVASGAATIAAYELQERICEEHLDRGGRFRPYLDGGWGLVCTEMGQWWRLVAIGDVYARHPLKRCRYCGSWFSTADGRPDRGFCSSAHRSAFNQRRTPAAPLFWAEVL